MKMDALRSDLVRGLIWFVNYAALDPAGVSVDQLDLQGTGMLPVDVELFAHRWLSSFRSVDLNHDGVGRPVAVAESFYNSPTVASPNFPVNSHAIRLDVSRSAEALEGLRSGALNSLSLDALTFNKVVKLPVAGASRGYSAGQSKRSAIPESLQDWAREVAQSGYTGVIGVRKVSDGLYLAARDSGMPLAIHIDEGSVSVEPSTSGGAWAALAAALYDSPTLTTLAAGPPPDYSPWSQSEVDELMRWIGLRRQADPATGELEREVFAVVDEEQRGLLPHHTVRGGELMVSADGVARAMARLGEVPAHLRAAAEAHLKRHMAEVRR